ncbi:MAG: DnaJ domain-containing protein [Candidatus Limnocylindria bacterium]
MAPPADPYRTLGLGRDASLDEVKRAYRRLAKEHHPDTAGEAAIPRFLAIRAAYDAIAGPDAAGPGRAGRRAPSSARPWEADPDRADATRRAYSARPRRTRPPRPRPGTSTGGPAEGADAPPPASDEPTRPPNLATLGSTSYDGTEGQPFEPDWGGASWYGTTSGTYWTLNPKEYADPRKHGPEYQARARRRRRTVAEAEAVAEAGTEATQAPGATLDRDAGAASPEGAAPDPAPPGGDAAPPGHSTTSWWDATAGPSTAEPARAPRSASTAPPVPVTAPPEPRAEAHGGGPATASDADAALRSRWLRDGRFGLLGRIGAAILGWVPIAVGVNALAGELSGCARTGTCTPADASLASAGLIVVLAVLLLVPLLARLAASAAIAALVVAVPGALLVAAAAASDLAAPMSALVVAGLVVSWAGGVGLAVLRESRRPPRPVS